MMRDSKSSEKKPIQEVQPPRSRKPKLERVSRHTTDYKKAEEVLLTERDKLISILEAMADGVYIANQKYDIEYVNPVLEKDFGALKGHKCYEYFHDRKESCSWCKNKDVLAGKTVRREWYSFKNKRTYDLVDTPLKNADGSVSKLQILRDITERKRIEEALKVSELRLRSLIEQTTDAVFCYEYNPPIPTDLPIRKQVKLLYNGLLVECNDVCAKSYGARRAEEVIGKRLTELFKTTPGSLEKLFKALIDGGYRIIDGEGVEKLEDGTERYYLNNGHGIIEDGKLVRVWGTFRDITESRKVEEQLKQSQEFLANTINALDDTFFVKDEEHRWAALNDAACAAIGRPREELIGKSDYDCFPKEQADKFWEKDNLVLETGETNVSVEEVTWRGKVHTISTKKSLFTDFITGKRFIVGTARDITERKQIEKKLREQEQQYRSFVENFKGIAFRGKMNFTPIFFHGEVEQITGYGVDEFLSGKLRWNQIIHKDDLDMVTGKLGKRIAEIPNSSGEREYRIFRKDGQIRWVHEFIRNICDDSGKPTFVEGIIYDITERKKTEESLQESEQKYRALIEQSMHGIVILQDYKIVFANKAACEIPGLTMEELLALSTEDMMAFIPPENRSTIRERLKDRFAGREVPQNYELRLIRKNREEFWLNLFFSNIEFQGRPAIQLAFYDISENKRMEETLRASEASYKELADSITDIFFAMDRNLRYTYWNKASEKLTGIPAEEAIGKSIFDIFPDTEATRKAAGVYQDILKTQQPRSFMNDYQLHGKDFSFEINAYPSRQGLSVFAKDITERLQAEKQLKQSQEFLANIINALDDPVFVKDEKHRWAVLNDAACEVMGRSREELIGKTDYDLFSKEQADVFWERDNYVLETGQTDVNEEEITWHGKLHTISTKKSVYTDSQTGKKFIAGTIRDITERKKAEQTLIESEGKFRNLAEQSPNMIFINKRGRVVYANKKCEEVMEYKKEEFCHPDFDFMTLIAPEFRQLIKTNLGRHMKGEEIEPYEYGLITKNGERLDAIITSKLIKYDGVDSILGTITDITERKKAQQEIAKLAKFPSEDPNPVLRISKDATILYANNASSVVLETWGRKVGERLPKACCERVEEAFSLGSASTFEFHCHNGQIFEVKLVPIMESGYANAYGLDITERKKAEEALKDSELKYRSLITNVPDVIWTSDEQGNTTFISENVEDVYGYTPEEIYTKSDWLWFGRIHPDDLERVKDSFRAVFEKEQPLNIEYRIRRKDGEWIWIRDRSIGAYEKNGIKYADGVFSEITERKKAEETLKESESRFRDLVENINVVFSMENAEGTELLYVSPTYEQIWGRSCQSFYDNPKEWINAIHPDDRRRVVDAFNEFRETGLYSEEFRILRPDGSVRWILDRGVLIHDESGQIHRSAGIAEDITEKKEAEIALRESEVTARALLNATTDAVLLIDKEGLIIDVNDKMSKWLGHARKDLIGTIVYNYLPPEIAEQRKTKGFDAVRTRRPISFEDQREGRWLENNVYPILDSHDEVSRFAIYSRDITQRKQAEEKLRDYQEQLKSLASQLTLAEEHERRRIATELHDEISQSLFISKMKLEALDKSTPDKKYDDTLDEINNSLGRIIAAMRSLTFDLSSPILYEFGFEEAVAEWLNEQVEKKHRIATELKDDGLPKQMDDDIRVIMFRNVKELLINVVKHARAKKVKVSIQKVGNRIRISVEDDGVGFDSAKAESLITKKEAFGLFSIRERLEHLGGNLEIESSPGCGCRITITSPLKREDIREGK